jgi:hypothetical protein
MRARIRRLLHSRRFRVGVAVLVVLVALCNGALLWTHGPDTVRVVITRDLFRGDGSHIYSGRRTVLLDRTIHDPAVAQRLQRAVDAVPLAITNLTLWTHPSDNGGLWAPDPLGIDGYTLTWSRNGMVVETAVGYEAGPNLWTEDGLGLLRRTDMYTGSAGSAFDAWRQINAAVGLPGNAFGLPDPNPGGP